MATRIKIATRTEVLDGLFRSRHQALVEELGAVFPQPDLRLVDRFDAFPSTRNIVALVDGEAVGGVRLCPWVGGPLEGTFDFAPNLPRDASAGSFDHFHLLEAHQASGQRLGLSLLYMLAHLASKQAMTHLVCCPAPRVARLAQSIGFQQLAPRFRREPGGEERVPMLLDLRQVQLPLLDMARKPGMLDAFEQVEWAFHSAGDAIIEAGTSGDAAYLIVDGEVIVSVERGSPSGRAAFELATLGPGQLFGELALLTDRKRTANVIAGTEVDLIVLQREVFRRELVQNPDRLPAVLEQLANRLADADDLLTR